MLHIKFELTYAFPYIINGPMASILFIEKSRIFSIDDRLETGYVQYSVMQESVEFRHMKEKEKFIAVNRIA